MTNTKTQKEIAEIIFDIVDYYSNLDGVDDWDEMKVRVVAELSHYAEQVRKEERERIYRQWLEIQEATELHSDMVLMFNEYMKQALSSQTSEKEPCGCEADEWGIEHTIDAHGQEEWSLTAQDKKKQCSECKRLKGHDSFCSAGQGRKGCDGETNGQGYCRKCG